jgi:hypothetical protein
MTPTKINQTIAEACGPEQCSIPVYELKMWLRHIAEGQDPNVAYNEDKTKMLTEAYQKRGAALYFLNSRIRCFVRPETEAELNKPTK